MGLHIQPNIKTALRRLTHALRTETTLIQMRTARRRVEAHLQKASYDPNQPREPAGKPTGGRWVSALLDQIDQIVADAQRFRLAAYSEKYSACVDLCYPLLERFQPPGSDFNLWDFHKCLNRCLGKRR